MDNEPLAAWPFPTAKRPPHVEQEKAPETKEPSTNPEWYFGTVLEAAIKAQDANCARIPVGDRVGDLKTLRAWLRDFRTIRLDIGQRTGKSYATALASTTDDALVLLNAGMRDYVKRSGFRGVIYAMDAVRRTAYDIRLGNGQPYVNMDYTGHSTIWVEPASLFTMDDLVDMYTAFSRDIDQRFILLG